jgi:hypothetical protein
MECPECARTIVPLSQQAATASTPDDAIYVCECGFRYSNSRDPAARTAFAPTPEANIPERYRPRLNETLAAAANIGNRASKAAKFTYSTSEDAVTWMIFRWLQDENALAIAAEAAGVSAPAGEAELLFWGAPVGGGETELSQQLRAICLAVDGKADRLTEPDVVIAWPGDVFFVEVKYRSANEHKAGYAHFERYTSGAAAAGLFAGSPADVAAGGWYELSRNWRIGAELATERDARLTLVNLGPARLEPEAAKFAATLEQTAERRFAFVAWKRVLEQARTKGTMSSDIDEFVSTRGLEDRWG